MPQNIEMNLEELETNLGYTFKNKELLLTALTHSSYANQYKKGKAASYERFEFLGDSILNIVVSEYLFRSFPHLPEGELTRNRANVVCEPTLAKCARSLEIFKFILLGKGEKNNGGNQRASILADVFEALIGAVYLDGGMDAAKQLVIGILEEPIHRSIKGATWMDYKSLLQELVQRTDDKIVYAIIDEKGPDHNKLFAAQVTINQKCVGIGQGKTKKEAEQNAAKEAYKKLHSS